MTCPYKTALKHTRSVAGELRFLCYSITPHPTSPAGRIYHPADPIGIYGLVVPVAGLAENASVGGMKGVSTFPFQRGSSFFATLTYMLQCVVFAQVKQVLSRGGGMALRILHR